MDTLLERIAPLLRHPAARVAIAVSIAVLYYAIVVAGEIGRSSTITVTAIPPALSLIWVRSRPAVSMGLAAGGILLLAAVMVNGYYVQAVTQQSAVLVAVFGGACSPRVRERHAAAALAALAAVLTVAFAFTRYSGLGGGAIDVAVLASALVALLALALVGGTAAGRFLDRGTRLGSDLIDAEQRGRAAERDVLIEIERNRIAREVHDVVAHSLAVVIAQADGARFAAEGRPDSVGPALDAIAETARRALGEVRTMLHDLRTSGEGAVPPGPDDIDGLTDGVRDLGLTVETSVFGERRELSRDAGLALYRVAQEALTNAVRYADRQQPVGIELDWGEREVVLVVTNRVAAEATVSGERSGHGIEGMRDRASDAGGDCTAGLGSNGRFRVRVALPVDPPPPEPALALPAASRPTLHAS